MRTDIPGEPAPARLPAPKARAARRGPRLTAFSVAIEVVTPILGGGSQTREIDEVDVIRPATVRGHLRFWWRALRGHQYARPEELYAAEGALWGKAATDEGGRSQVDLRISMSGRPAAIDPDRVTSSTQGAYALWPAREERNGRPTAPRRRPGTRFRITITTPADREAELRDVVRAWLLFGGYGSRTRRGLGGLTVTEDAAGWLPRAATQQAFEELFGRDVFQAPRCSPVPTPWLAGASLHAGKARPDAVTAWTAALDWLKEFRQGTGGGEGGRAREPGRDNRPSISNWPEADKVRRLTGRTRGHAPRHNAEPAWPRAGFGLPIVGRFQTEGRHRERLDEPDDFTLVWRAGDDRHDRLASPLIVKALPLTGGRFAPCALWLNRAGPAGEVVLDGVAGSGAPFDRLVAPGDTPRFNALRPGETSLRAAFLAWLQDRYGTTAVAQ